MTTCIFPNSTTIAKLFHAHAVKTLMSTGTTTETLTKSPPLKNVQKTRTFQIFIKTLTGQSVTIDIASKDKVIDLKYKIWMKINIPVESQRLIFQMSQLEDERLIESYNIQKESTIHLALRLVAGVQVKLQTNEGRVYALNDTNTLADSTNTYNHYQQSQMYNLQDSKKRGSYTKKACANCRKSHSACDAGRPCKRCLQLGLTDCLDAQRKSKKREFEDMNNFKPYTNMMDFLPLLGQIPQKSEPQIKKEISFEEEDEKSLELQDLFSDLMDIDQPPVQTLKKPKYEVYEDFPTVEEESIDDFQFPNDLSFSLENNDLTLGSLVDIKNDVDLFPEEETSPTAEKEEIEEELIEFTSSKEFEKSIVPFNQYDQNSRNVIIPREEVQELTNGDPAQDLLIKSLMLAHLKQEQELRELRDLVSNLQNLLIAQASIQNPPRHCDIKQ